MMFPSQTLLVMKVLANAQMELAQIADPVYAQSYVRCISPRGPIEHIPGGPYARPIDAHLPMNYGRYWLVTDVGVFI